MFTRLFTFTGIALVVCLYGTQVRALTPQIPGIQESASDGSGTSLFDRFSKQEVVEMTLVTQLDSLIQVRNTNDYREASLTYIDDSGASHRYDVKVKPRGRFRRRICDFPPLKLKFSKDQLKEEGLSKHNDMKLVTHCLNQEPYDESLVLREYLVYKMYNELTPKSFRVQLVRITYQDEVNPDSKIKSYGFLIEDVDELADRLGGKECEDCFGLPEELVHSGQEKIASMFQYFIGNTDWNVEMERNVKMIRMEDGTHIPVPYDFDFSVFVSAPYLRPNSDLNQTPQMERIYMGYSETYDEIFSTLSYYKTKKNALLNVIRNFKLINRADRLALENYLNSFFNRIEQKDVEPILFKHAVPDGKG